MPAEHVQLFERRGDAAVRIATLTARERQILRMLLAGHHNKNIAADLDISQRTVEYHRAAIMRKTGSRSFPELAMLAIAAAWGDGGEPTAAGGANSRPDKGPAA